MKVALVCIAKNEDYYIQEWINFNVKLGFNQIFIYENDWKSNLNHPLVTTIPFPGKVKQLPAYNNFINTYKKEYDYVAFFDCDEFLILKKHQTIQDFLTDYNLPNSIGINWQLYGSNGKEKREDNSLIKQFTKRQIGVDKHVKSIVKLMADPIMLNPHFSNLDNMDTNKKLFKGPFNKNGDDNIAVINHYYQKTYEDWNLRCKRGRADCNETHNPNEWINSININNDVEDLTALNFLYNQ